MSKPETNQTERPPLKEVLDNASAAHDAAEVSRLTKDLTNAVAGGVGVQAQGSVPAPAPVPTPTAAPRRKFNGHSQATVERLLAEERTLVDTLNDLDRKIGDLEEQRDDAFAAYSAIKATRESLGVGN